MPEALYDEIAAWYDASVRGGSLLTDLALHSLLELIGDAADRQICDLACGQGLVARELARRGARVTGIDLSAKLLEIARRDEANEPLGISYQRDDAQALATIGGVQFDGVACNLALMDIGSSGLPSLRGAGCPAGRLVRLLDHSSLLPDPVLGVAVGRC